MDNSYNTFFADELIKEGDQGHQWKLDKLKVDCHNFTSRGSYAWVKWLKGVQKLNWFEVSGIMQHEDYEKLLDAVFEMYERFGLTSERAEDPEDEHLISVKFEPYKYERIKNVDEVRDRIREKICKFLLSLKVERKNTWFNFYTSHEIMSAWEPDLENQSILLTYKKSGSDENDVYEYQAQQQ